MPRAFSDRSPPAFPTASSKPSTATCRPPSARPKATEPSEISKPSSTSSPETFWPIHPLEIATSLGKCVAALLVLGVIILSPLQVAEDIEAGLTRAKKHRTNTTSYTNCCKWIILCHHTHPRVGSFCRNKFGPFHFYIHPKVGGPSWLQ